MFTPRLTIIAAVSFLNPDITRGTVEKYIGLLVSLKLSFKTCVIVNMTPAENIHIRSARPASPGPLYSDFFQQQVAKQRNNNYHSTSLRNMVATSVNRTALHPGGVQYVFPYLPCCPANPCRSPSVFISSSCLPSSSHTSTQTK